MAQNGRVYLLGDGSWKANPIATDDLAAVVLDLYEKKVPEAEVGGPEVLTQRKIAELAFNALGKKAVITGLPTGLASTAVKLMRRFTPISVYGPLEFFVEAASRDMIATKYGSSTLEIFFNSIVHKNNKP